MHEPELIGLTDEEIARVKAILDDKPDKALWVIKRLPWEADKIWAFMITWTDSSWGVTFEQLIQRLTFYYE